MRAQLTSPGTRLVIDADGTPEEIGALARDLLGPAVLVIPGTPPDPRTADFAHVRPDPAVARARANALDELARHYSGKLAEDRQDGTNFDCAVLDALAALKRDFGSTS